MVAAGHGSRSSTPDPAGSAAPTSLLFLVVLFDGNVPWTDLMLALLR
jgi:hypothetical protein